MERVGSDDFFHCEHLAIIISLSSFTFFRTAEASRRLESSTEDSEIEPSSSSAITAEASVAEEGDHFVTLEKKERRTFAAQLMQRTERIRTIVRLMANTHIDERGADFKTRHTLTFLIFRIVFN